MSAFPVPTDVSLLQSTPQMDFDGIRANRCVLTIAGWSVEVASVPEYIRLFSNHPFRRFVDTNAVPQARLLVCPVAREEWLDAIRSAPAKQPGDTAPPRIMRTATLRRRVECRAATELLSVQDTRVDFYEPGNAFLESHGYDYGSPPRFMEGRLMRLLATTLVRGNGLLLHGAGVVIEGSSVAIIGPSGAGKTTAANLMHADSLLSDDIVAATECDCQPRLHGTPLGRETDGPVHAPMRALFFPRKAASFALTPLPYHEALARAVAEQHECLSLLFEPYVGEAFLHFCHLLKRVPAYELAFSLEGGIDRAAVRDVLSHVADHEVS